MRLYSASKDSLNVLAQINSYLQIGDRITTTLFSIIYHMVVKVFLVITVTDRHILAILPEEQTAIVCKCISAFLREYKIIPIDAVLNYKLTEKVTKMTLYETGNIAVKKGADSNSTIVQAAKKTEL